MMMVSIVRHLLRIRSTNKKMKPHVRTGRPNSIKSPHKVGRCLGDEEQIAYLLTVYKETFEIL